MTLDRWNSLARVMRAPPDDVGTVAPAAVPAAPVAEAAPAAPAAAPAAEAAPQSAPSLLAAADAGKREGADTATAKESKDANAASGTRATETPAQAGDAPPPGGTEGDTGKSKDDAGAKPDVAAGRDVKDVKPGETTESKPDGAEAAADKKPGEGETAPQPPPAYDAYKLPENLKLDDVRLQEFNGLLGETELAGKADHAAMQGLGQKLIDFYANEVQRIGEQVSQHQRDVWNRVNEQRINELKSHEQLGGNRIDTTLGSAKYVIEQFGGSKDEQAQLLAELDSGGVSNSLRFVSMLHRIYERYREPEPVSPNLPSVKANGAGQRNWYGQVDGKQ